MALQAVDCTECHSPHAAKQEHLVKAAGGGECTGCHTDKAAGKDEAAHGAIGFLGCRGCHQPHGGDNERMLRASRSEICLGCHDAARRKSAENNSVVLLDHFRIGESAAERVKRIPALRVVNGNVVDHPVTGHRATGKPTAEELKRTTTTFEGELGCLVCHDPHKGPSSRHFAGGVRSAAELCLKCHKK